MKGLAHVKYAEDEHRCARAASPAQPNAAGAKLLQDQNAQSSPSGG
jgi:hypothetical protein